MEKRIPKESLLGLLVKPRGILDDTGLHQLLVRGHEEVAGVVHLGLLGLAQDVEDVAADEVLVVGQEDHVPGVSHVLVLRQGLLQAGPERAQLAPWVRGQDEDLHSQLVEIQGAPEDLLDGARGLGKLQAWNRDDQQPLSVVFRLVE